MKADKQIVSAIIIIIIFEVILWSYITMMGTMMSPGGSVAQLGILRFGGGLYIDSMLLMGLCPLYCIVAVLLSYISVSPLIDILQIIGGKNQQIVMISTKPNKPFWKYFSQSIFPAFLGFSIGSTLSSYRDYFWVIFKDFVLIIPELFILYFMMLVIPVSTFIFNLFWSIDAVGLLIFKKNKYNPSDIYIENLGDHNLRFLKGFTGLTTLISLSLVIYNFISNYILISGSINPMVYGIIVWIIFYPILGIISIVPAAIIGWKLIQRSKRLETKVKKFRDVTDKFEALTKKVWE